MTRLRQALDHPFYIPALRFLCFGTLLCLAALAAVLYLWFSGARDEGAWMQTHFREAVSVILFSFDLTVGIAFLCDRENSRR